MTDENKEMEEKVEQLNVESTEDRNVKIPQGRIFQDSLNLYDDEAKIAFEYFRKAAEKIIAEEDRIKAEIATAEKEITDGENEKKQGKLLAIILFFLIIPIFVGMMKMKAGEKKIAEAKEKITKLNQDFDAIKRDYTISKLGIAYVPIATEVPFENKSFILDDTPYGKKQEFKLHQINAQSEFLDTLASMQEKTKQAPIAEESQMSEDIPAKTLVPSFEKVHLNDYLGELDRNLRATSYFLKDLTTISVSLPMINPNGEYATFLKDFCTTETGDRPILNVFENTSYEDDLKRFDAMNEMQKRISFSKVSLDNVMQAFISDIANHVQLISKTKIASISKVLSMSGETLLNSFKASYNHYSPVIAKEEIEKLQNEDFSYNTTDPAANSPFLLSTSSRVHYDAISNNWVAEDGSRVTSPLGIHQIQEDIISPLVQNLLRETRIERLKIYNDIVDQKTNYIKEWQKEVDDFYGRGRAEGNDIINQMQQVLGEFTTAYSQYKAFLDTEKMIVAGDEDASQNMQLNKNAENDTILAFKQQADDIESKKNAFNEYVERLQEEIERRAEGFSYTKDFEATLRDGHAKEAVMALLGISQLDERRKELLAANAYIAQKAKLPPQPTVNDELYSKLGVDLSKIAETMQSEIENFQKEPDKDISISDDAQEYISVDSNAVVVATNAEGGLNAGQDLLQGKQDESEINDDSISKQENETPLDIDTSKVRPDEEQTSAEDEKLHKEEN